MTVIVKHNKTNTITDWTQAQLDEQIALGNFAPGTTLANIVLPSDWNNDHTLTGLGTMAEQDATAVAITGGTINNTTIGATTATTGKFTSVTTPSVTATTDNLTLSAISTGAVNLNTLGGTQFKAIDATSSVNVWNVRGGDGSTTSPRFTTEGTGTNIAGQFNTKGTGALQFFSGNTEQMRITNTASAVNYVQVTGGTTGNSPVISAQGSDAAVALSITSKSTNAIRFLSNNAANLQFRIVGTNTAVNNLAVTGTIATNAPSLSSEGSDTNISMAFQPKGTGAIDLAAGSSGVNISNGGTVTAVTRTQGGSGYTTAITGTVSAPTTAGGVQATVNVGTGAITVAIAGGGTGYTVGDTLTVVGGTFFTNAQTLTVSTVSAGVITAVAIASYGNYSVLPTNPVSVTGGTGSGATFNLSNWSMTTVSVNNAGSGYIEQPTVSFSGGGGSGAAAYATVGSGTIARSIGSTMSFYNPSGETLRLTESGGTSVVGLNIINGSSNQNTVYMYPYGSGANPNTILGSKGTGFVGLYTGSNNDSNGTQQFRVSHTASAVNYVQVTGATTLNPPVISAQGSDSTVALLFQAKGGQNIRFYSAAGSAEQFRITHTAGTIANYASVTGNVAGSAPSFSVGGSDTNIDLALTPKGTGLVRFGTYVAGALTATGYINIKAADGTTYKVLVST